MTTNAAPRLYMDDPDRLRELFPANGHVLVLPTDPHARHAEPVLGRVVGDPERGFAGCALIHVCYQPDPLAEPISRPFATDHLAPATVRALGKLISYHGDKANELQRLQEQILEDLASNAHGDGRAILRRVDYIDFACGDFCHYLCPDCVEDEVDEDKVDDLDRRAAVEGDACHGCGRTWDGRFWASNDCPEV